MNTIGEEPRIDARQTEGLILDRLDALKIHYEHYTHHPVHTIDECLDLPYAEEDVTFCKNILLCNRQQTQFYLYVTVPKKPFRTADVSKLLGVSRLSFAPDDALPRLLQLYSGSLTPLALWLNPDSGIQLVLDREIRQPGRIAFHPAVNTATVIFRQEDFFSQVVPALPGEPVFLDVPWPAMPAGV